MARSVQLWPERSSILDTAGYHTFSPCVKKKLKTLSEYFREEDYKVKSGKRGDFAIPFHVDLACNKDNGIYICIRE